MFNDFFSYIYLILFGFQFERQKKLERLKRKQHASSLEETKEQIAQLEQNLAKYKTEKHELFHSLFLLCGYGYF